MSVTVFTAAGSREIEPTGFADVLVGEPLGFAPGAALSLLEGDAKSVKLDGNVATFDAPGVYRLSISAALTMASVKVIVVEPAALERVFISPDNVSVGGSIAASKRGVLKSLLLHGWDGTVAGMNAFNLQHHGASRGLTGGAVRVR